MKKLLLIFSSLFLMAASIYADPIDKEKAMSIASKFISSKAKRAQGMNGKGTALIPVQETTLMQSFENYRPGAVHAFTIGEQDGGVIFIAGDDCMNEVIGYTDHGSWSDNMPPALKAYMNAICLYVDSIQRNEYKTLSLAAETEDSNENEGNNEGDGSEAGGDTPSYPVVEPLIQTHWGQDWPYDAMCPIDIQENEPSATGCVATAMAQIMAYWKWPKTGKGSNSYFYEAVGDVSADFSQSTYDWENMCNTYLYDGTYTDEEIAAPALLMRDAGIAVNMEYSSWGSAAYSPDVTQALFANFGYKGQTLQMLKRYSYTKDQWMEIIQNELTNRRPIYYGGASMRGGHAFVCDGMDADGFVHINWGWEGFYDGYFDINAMSYDGQSYGRYNLDQEIIVGIEPNYSEEPEMLRTRVSMYSGLYASGQMVDRDKIKVYTYWLYSTSPIVAKELYFGIGLYKDGELKQVVASKKYEGSAEDLLSGISYLEFTNITIPDDVPDGNYELGLLCHDDVFTEWTEPQTFRYESTKAGLTLSKEFTFVYNIYPKYNFSISDISFTNQNLPYLDNVITAVNLTIDVHQDFSSFELMKAIPVHQETGKVYGTSEVQCVALADGSSLDYKFRMQFDRSMPSGDYDIYLAYAGYSKIYLVQEDKLGTVRYNSEEAADTLFSLKFDKTLEEQGIVVQDIDGLQPTDEMKEKFGVDGPTSWFIHGDSLVSIGDVVEDKELYHTNDVFTLPKIHIPEGHSAYAVLTCSSSDSYVYLDAKLYSGDNTEAVKTSHVYCSEEYSKSMITINNDVENPIQMAFNNSYNSYIAIHSLDIIALPLPEYVTSISSPSDSDAHSDITFKKTAGSICASGNVKSMAVYDMQGRKMASAEGNSIAIPTDGGMYIIKATDANGKTASMKVTR